MQKFFKSKIWWWLSNIFSLIGVISVIGNLKQWKALCLIFLDSLKDLYPYLKPFIEVTGHIFNIIIELYRLFTYPVYSFLFGWLPFDLPDIIFDVFFLITIVIIASARALWIFNKEFDELLENRKTKLKESLIKNGLDPDIIYSLDMDEVYHGLEYAKNPDRPRGTEPWVNKVKSLFGAKLNLIIDDLEPIINSFLPSFTKYLNKHNRMIAFWIITGLFLLILISTDNIMK